MEGRGLEGLCLEKPPLTETVSWLALPPVAVILEMEGHPEEVSHMAEQVAVHGVMVVRAGKHPPQRLSAWN